MAQSGFTPIQVYRSATPGAVPLAANLAPGELALNTADEKLFFENAAGTVVSIDRPTGTFVANLGAVGTPSYTFTGDLNTGMWSPAADTIAFSEGGAEAMRITSAGDVGIGTTTPSSKLAVYGGASGADTRVTIGNAASAIQVGVGSANETFLSGNAAFPMLLYTNGTERMRITSTGDVGIGTTAPGGLLQLNKASGAADLRLSVAGTLYGNIYASASDVDIFAVTAIPIIFGTTNTERFRIGPAGQWGIGGANYGTSGQVLTSQGGASAPIWSNAAAGTVTSVSGTGTVNGLTLSGTVTGSGNLTLGGTLSGVSLTTQVSGTLPVGNGGTGITTTPSNGQIPIGNGTNYVAATLTAGNNTAITNASGSVTVGAGALTTAGTTSGALVAADAFKQVKATAGVTMPASVFSADQYVYIRNTSAGSITVTSGGGLTLRFVALTGNRTLAQYGFMTVLYISATEAWVVGGVGVT